MVSVPCEHVHIVLFLDSGVDDRTRSECDPICNPTSFDLGVRYLAHGSSQELGWVDLCRQSELDDSRWPGLRPLLVPPCFSCLSDLSVQKFRVWGWHQFV